MTERMTSMHGSVLDALHTGSALLKHRDIYVTGPPAMLRELSRELNALGVDSSRTHIDSFGV